MKEIDNFINLDFESYHFYSKSFVYSFIFIFILVLICLFSLFVEKVPDVPFLIKRSKMNNLPVYTDHKGGGTRHITIIRKIKGDLKVRNCPLEK